MAAGGFLIIGDGLDAASVLPRSSVHVQRLKDGREAVAFGVPGGKILGLPVPDGHKATDAHRAGGVSHVTVALEHGLNGSPARKQAAMMYVQSLASRQVAKGAAFVGVRVDAFGDSMEQRRRAMRWLIPALQEVCDRPLALEAEDPRLLKAALECYDAMKSGRPMLVAATIDKPPVFKLAAKFRAHTVVRCTGPDPLRRMRTGSERLRYAAHAMKLAADAGIPPGDIYLDPVVLPAARDDNLCPEILAAIREMRSRWPAAHVAGRYTIATDKLPLRSVLDAVWLKLVREAGADAVILDPVACPPDRIDTLDFSDPAVQMAHTALTGGDPWFAEFVAAARAREIADPFTDDK